VAFCANFNLDVLLGGHGFHYIAAVAGNGGLFKNRMNSFLHDFHLHMVAFIKKQQPMGSYCPQ
jgi:hypothetical protein